MKVYKEKKGERRVLPDLYLMDSVIIGCWNIRGLNALVKREAIKKTIRLHNISIFSVLETRVSNNMERQLSHWFGDRWGLIDNAGTNRNICILVLQDQYVIELNRLWMDDQVMYCEIMLRVGTVICQCTFVRIMMVLLVRDCEAH